MEAVETVLSSSAYCVMCFMAYYVVCFMHVKHCNGMIRAAEWFSARKCSRMGHQWWYQLPGGCLSNQHTDCLLA